MYRRQPLGLVGRACRARGLLDLRYWLSIDSAMRRSSSFSWLPSL